MAIIFTPDLGLAKPDLYSDQKENYYADAFDQINRALGGYLAIAQGDANYTLQDISAARESRTFALKFTSTLTAARTLLIDTTTSGLYRNRLFVIWNASSGNFKLTVKTAAGGSTGVDINSGYCRAVWHDGTNVYAFCPEINPTTGLMLGPSPSFTAPTLLHSWVNYGGSLSVAGYALHLGLVYLKGVIKDGTMGQSAFTLPAGYRPSLSLLFPSIANDVLCRIDISSVGDVTPTTLSGGSNAYVILDGISFAPV